METQKMISTNIFLSFYFSVLSWQRDLLLGVGNKYLRRQFQPNSILDHITKSNFE